MMPPRQVVKLRTDTCEYYGNPNGFGLHGSSSGHRRLLGDIWSTLGRTRLYWASADMTALAVAASRTIPAFDWRREARPAASGLLYLDEGIAPETNPLSGPREKATADGVDQAFEQMVAALSWWPTGDALTVTAWASKTVFIKQFKANGGNDHVASQLADFSPPLIPVEAIDVATDGPQGIAAALAETGPILRTPLAVLQTAWCLMTQPAIIDETEQSVDKTLRRQLRRNPKVSRPDDPITLVDVRKAYIPGQGDESTETDAAGRTYRHRWVVSGHWRNQAHGPARQKRKRIWVPAYVKGPDGAPILATERVNVWKH